jgi:hypothetical protein
MPREGIFELARFGRVRNAQDADFGSAGLWSVALKRIPGESAVFAVDRVMSSSSGSATARHAAARTATPR